MHFLLMSLVAAVIAIVMAVIDHEHQDLRGRVVYGLKVFGAFVGIGTALGLVMRFVPL